MPVAFVQFLDKSSARGHARAVWREFLADVDRTRELERHLRDFLDGAARSATGVRLLSSIPLNDEFDHRPAWSDFPGAVYLPVVEGGGKMEFHHYLENGRTTTELEPGPFGLMQPAGGSKLTLPLGGDDIVLLPGLAAESNGARLGRGGGYYDRWRERLLPARLIGILPRRLAHLEFPAESHDLRLNGVVTESGLVDY